MLIFAQVEADQLVQFVAFNTEEVAEVHVGSFPNAMFILTEFFGSPSSHRYNPETGKIEPISLEPAGFPFEQLAVPGSEVPS